MAFSHALNPGEWYNTGNIEMMTSKGIVTVPSDRVAKREKTCKYKLLCDRAGGMMDGKQTSVIHGLNIIKPNVIHNGSFISFTTQKGSIEDITMIKKYLSCKLPRFILLVYTANKLGIPVKAFEHVPLIELSTEITDQDLYQLYNITQEEIDYIDRLIKPME